jgi:hypothetical protein
MMNSEDVFRLSIGVVAAVFILAVGFEIFRESVEHRKAQDALTIAPSQPNLATNSAPMVRSWRSRTGPGAFTGPQTGTPVSTETSVQ